VYFTKIIDITEKEQLELEVAKCRTAEKILLGKDSVFTPKLISVDKQRGILLFERIEGMGKITYRSAANIFKCLGRSLARLHIEMKLNENQTYLRYADIGNDYVVYVHGKCMHLY
jgi:tRNA A-37 threonylcarbamoyl transferase component Bud32